MRSARFASMLIICNVFVGRWRRISGGGMVLATWLWKQQPWGSTTAWFCSYSSSWAPFRCSSIGTNTTGCVTCSRCSTFSGSRLRCPSRLTVCSTRRSSAQRTQQSRTALYLCGIDLATIYLFSLPFGKLWGKRSTWNLLASHAMQPHSSLVAVCGTRDTNFPLRDASATRSSTWK